MALDKLVDSTQLDNNLTSVANAIRAKSGGTGQLAFPAGFVSEIGNISGGGGITPTGTKEITIIENGTTTEDVTNYANAQITVNVSSSSGDTNLYEKILARTVSGAVHDDTIKEVGERAFAGCSQITSLYLGGLTKLNGSRQFIECGNLQIAVLPKYTGTSTGSTFNTCAKLTTADLKCNIAANYFANSANFTTLILRNTSVATLAKTNAFNNTTFKSGGTGGTLYVPQSLISSYQSASIWSTILGYTNNQILPIEGSIYETQYADGTPIE